VFFLDTALFHISGTSIPKPRIEILTQAGDLVDDVANLRTMAAKYFSTIHSWMPIICKRRFYEHYLNPLSGAANSADVSLLFLCMKLMVSGKSDNEQRDMYLRAKRWLLDLEIGGGLSLQVMQASLLVALFEFGNAIFPSAYISVGTCARMGVALGFDVGEEIERLGWLNRVEVEEGRRTWWGVLALDRFITPENFPALPLNAE